MTTAGFVAIGLVVGLVSGYLLGAIRQIQGKDEWLKDLFE